MLVLTIRTDKPESELGLYDDDTQLAYLVWHAHRQLAETINLKIKELLERQSESLQDLDGIVVFQGPGSFTGLRIGLSVANTLAYGLRKPIAASQDPDWIKTGIDRLENNENDELALPYYGAPVRITQQKH